MRPKKTKNEDYTRLLNCMKWRNLRNAKIKANPICEICNEHLAEEVHHITPIENYSNNPKMMEELAYNPENLQSLCKSCHYEVHRKLLRERLLNKDKLQEQKHKETEDFISRFLD